MEYIGIEKDKYDLFLVLIQVLLNMQVIFYEQDWNPQVDKQALQRAHRIGQISHVLSINLVTEHSVEEVCDCRSVSKHKVIKKHYQNLNACVSGYFEEGREKVAA